jgi:hypothetical protein
MKQGPIPGSRQHSRLSTGPSATKTISSMLAAPGDADSTTRATRDGLADTPVSSRSSRRAHAIRLSPSQGVPPGSTQSSSPSCVRWTSKAACLRTTRIEHRTSYRTDMSRPPSRSGKQDPSAVWRRPARQQEGPGGIHRRVAQGHSFRVTRSSRPGHRVGRAMPAHTANVNVGRGRARCASATC